MLTPEMLPLIQSALVDAKIDGWLLYDFRGTNPIAKSMIGLEGFASRRALAWIPAAGIPVAITHNIEQGPWKKWPAAWLRERYSSWRSLESLLGRFIAGRTIAMETSGDGAVPYLDRIPGGALDMVRGMGATIISSGDLVTRFYAAWGDAHLASHRRAAELIAVIGKDALHYAGTSARDGRPVAEHEVQQRILDAFARAGLSSDHPPNVSAGANAADPHYEPTSDRVQLITRGNVLLIDLWAREEPDGVYADQTWMAVLGPASEKALVVWAAIRDARDAAIALIRDRVRAGIPVRGAEADDAARAVIDARGFGEYFTHRTGHSIDPRDLHGSGPNLDNLETRDDRVLIPGTGFSIEPGIYIEGEMGMRTEVNACLTSDDLIVTPREPQRELIVV